MPTFAAILPAAGRSQRFGRDKLAQPLLNRPVLARSIDAFITRPDVAQIVVPSQNPQESADFLGPHFPAEVFGRLHYCQGGASRAHSVLCALNVVHPDVEWVAIHDAARPLISQTLIDQTLHHAVREGNAVPALAVHLTLRQASPPLPARATQYVKRSNLFSMQTPQVMRRTDLLDAYSRVSIPLEDVTDDAQLLELAGHSIFLLPGQETNLKITTPLDFTLAEILLRQV